MVTAAELGLSQAEFEAAMNMEVIYELAAKNDCDTCSNSNIAYVDTVENVFLCNSCGDAAGAKKIAVTNFTNSEVEALKKNVRGSSSVSKPPPAKKTASKKKNPPKKQRQKPPSSSSSSSFSSLSSSSSSSSYKKKKKSKPPKPKKQIQEDQSAFMGAASDQIPGMLGMMEQMQPPGIMQQPLHSPPQMMGTSNTNNMHRMNNNNNVVGQNHNLGQNNINYATPNRPTTQNMQLQGPPTHPTFTNSPGGYIVPNNNNNFQYISSSMPAPTGKRHNNPFLGRGAKANNHLQQNGIHEHNPFCKGTCGMNIRLDEEYFISPPKAMYNNSHLTNMNNNAGYHGDKYYYQLPPGYNNNQNVQHNNAMTPGYPPMNYPGYPANYYPQNG